MRLLCGSEDAESSILAIALAEMLSLVVLFSRIMDNGYIV